METLDPQPPAKSRPLLTFFLRLLGVWLLAWLPIGLFVGDPDYVLTAVSRDTTEREVYQGFLYSGLLLVFLDSWRRYAPARPGRGTPADFGRYAGLGLVSAVVLRLAMVGLGARAFPAPEMGATLFLTALLSALVVALVEEAVFRGFLLGRLAQSAGLRWALPLSSALFASVHLFRPGPLEFKLGYGLGLFLLALFLGRVAWKRSSICASAGLHAGIILPNLLDPWPGLDATWWSGWQGEPASGAVSWLLIALLWGSWERWQHRGSLQGP